MSNKCIAEENFWKRANVEEAGVFEKYSFALNWAVASLTGNSFGDVTPKTYYENCLATVILVVGASVFSKNFADFNSLIQLLNQEKETNK